jgi:hypothetical protein
VTEGTKVGIELREVLVVIISGCKGLASVSLTKAGVGKISVVLGHSICDRRKPCLAAIRRKQRFPFP